MEEVKPIITPTNFEDKNDSIELVKELNKVKELRKGLKNYAKEFVKSFHKTAKEVMEYIPDSDIKNWKILPEQLRFFYNEDIFDKKSIYDVLKSISGDSKAYFINFDSKEVHLFWYNDSKLKFKDNNIKILKFGTFCYSELEPTIHDNDEKITESCVIGYMTTYWEKTGPMLNTGYRAGRSVERSRFVYAYFRHSFCLKTNKYLGCKLD